MKINKHKITFAIVLFSVCCAFRMTAQQALDISSHHLSSVKDPIVLHDQSQMRRHVSHLFQSDQYNKLLLENTQNNSPLVYQSMMDSSSHAIPPHPVVGDRANFYVTNFQLQNYEQVTAELRATTPKTNIYVEVNEYTSGHVTTGALDSLVMFLTQKVPKTGDYTEGIISLEQNIFGSPPNKDGDSVLDILIYDIKDGYNGNGDFVSGYFSPIDQTNSIESNRRDIIYLDSYPTLFPASNISLWMSLQAAAHEYQHLIHYNYDRRESTFINEGCSMEAENLCGFVRLEVNQYFSNTNVPLMKWDTTSYNPLNDLTRAQYFTLYLERQFGISFLKKLVNDSLHGLDGITSALKNAGQSVSGNDVFESWTIANQVQNSSIDSKYGYGGTASLSEDGIERYPYPIHTFYSDNIPLSSDTIQPMSAMYLSIKNVGYFTARFSGSSFLKYYFTTPTSVMQLIHDSTFSIPGVYPEVVFVVINTNPDSSFVFHYKVESKSSSTEIFYDTGQPDTLFVDGEKNTYITVGNSVASGGAGYALGFLPPENSTLVRAKYYVAFAQELPGSTTPETAPRTFAAHIWKKDKTKPGWNFDNLIEVVRYTIDRKQNPVGTFYEVPLASWSVPLTNLKDTVYVGYTDDDPYATAIGLTELPGPGSHSFLYTGNTWIDPMGTIKKNRWYSFNELAVGQQQVSLNKWEIMIRTVWQQPLSSIKSDMQSESFELRQNYPNPFNTQTNIQFVLTKPSDVSLKIYDVLGREAATITKGKFDAGIFTTTWDGRNDFGRMMPSGIYFCKLQSGEKQITKKMILSQ